MHRRGDVAATVFMRTCRCAKSYVGTEIAEALIIAQREDKISEEAGTEKAQLAGGGTRKGSSGELGGGWGGGA